MKVFIFAYVNELTANYHHSGGLVVIAENRESAESMMAGDEYIKVTAEEWAEVIVHEVDATQPSMYIFPECRVLLMIALLERKALRADDLIPPEEETRLQSILDALYRRVLLELHFLVRDSVPVNPAAFRLDDAATNAILEHAAHRVVLITESTRRDIAELLQKGQLEGLTTEEIADSIKHLFDITYKNRHVTIASNEISEAQYQAALDRYHATGLVDRVKISDATRGSDHTETCLARAGTTVPLDEAPPRDHVLCSLVLIPIVREGVI